jgi:sulfite reductase (NADPH) flavoprotein alpha-component
MLSTLRIDNSPFNEQQLRQLKSSIGGLNAAQSQWLSGFLAGRLAESTHAASPLQTLPEPASLLNVIYATETGHSESIASELAASLEQQGFSVELHSMDNFRPATLRKLKNVAFVISTHGEGDPPDEALALFEYLESERAPKLSELNYRVLALGDRSYQFFCEAGRKLDKRLQTLGARPFGQRVECDVDFADDAQAYNEEVIQYVRDKLATDKQSPATDFSGNPHLSLVPHESRWSRRLPFTAEVGAIQKITGAGSTKDVYHIELSLEDSGLQYQPGDALGIWAPNDPQVVDRILEILQIDPAKQVHINDQQLSIKDALTDHLEITRLGIDTVFAYANVGDQNQLKTLFSGFEADQQQDFIKKRQLADLVDGYPAQFAPQALVELLRPLAPRSYSIASSQQMVDEEVHLTVATLYSNAIGKTRRGVASGLLNHRLKPGETVKVFLEPNRRFRLPDDEDTPIIMIAAGTGCAPYRAFMQELEARSTKNRTAGPDSWLIFGNPHLRTDFLYQREWLRWRDTGLLNRIDTAWSRDQAEKRYVQNLVEEQAERIDQWLQRGAHIYLCGSLQMGQAVQLGLQNALAQQRGIGSDAAATLLAELRRERRIQKDLY